MSVGAIIGAVLWVLLYLGIALQLVWSRKEPDLRAVWLLLFALLPPITLIIYLLVGINYRRVSVRERLHARSLNYFHRDVTPQMKEAYFNDSAVERLPERYRPLARLLLGCGEGNKVYEGNSLEIITSGLRKRELLLEDIRRAQQYIHIEYFRFGNDKAGREVRDLLYQKAAQGVQVRFLNNNLVGRQIPRSFFRDMRKHGIEMLPYTHIHYGLRTFLMRINRQNHRKIVIIDGKVAYTGGMNLNDNYFYRWRDTHLRIEGPAIARLQVAFIDNWFTCGGKLSHPLPYYMDIPLCGGEGPLKDKTIQIVTDACENPWPTTQMAYEWILQNAREYLYIQTPYFVPPPSFLQALQAASLRGVDVRVMVPRRVDTPLAGPANRSYYKECMEAGIRIYERSGEFIHSKTLVCDDYLSIVGASNLDMRSFVLNNEVNTIIYDTQTALHCKEVFLADERECQEIQLAQWLQERRWYENFFSRFMRLFYRML